MRRVTLVCTLLLPLLVAGCGDDDPPETPTAPTIPTVTDTFTGTLTRNGATSHPFLVTSIVGGSVTATLKAVTPNAETVVGLTLGTWNGVGVPGGDLERPRHRPDHAPRPGHLDQRRCACGSTTSARSRIRRTTNSKSSIPERPLAAAAPRGRVR